MNDLNWLALQIIVLVWLQRIAIVLVPLIVLGAIVFGVAKLFGWL